jgi:3-mercaptopyruvate sulfurtransferase SseA
MLQQRGVKDIRALLGGWNQWINDGNKIVKGDR